MRLKTAFSLAVVLGLSACDKPAEKSEPGPSSAPAKTTTTTLASAPASGAEAAIVATVDQSPANPVLARKLLTAEEAASGWISLFDGESLFGWKSTKEDINWSVKDGAITADSGSNGVLLSSVPFGDFELICEFRAAEGTNSGVFLRCNADPKSITEDFYEVNIADSQKDGYLTASLVERAKATEEIKGSAGDWNTLRMIANGKSVQVFYNGKSVLEYTDETPALRLSGYVGLQKNSGKIEFRKVNLKPLNQTSLFNGTDLTGWRVVPGSKSEFTVADKAIHAVNGAGFLETAEAYKDFVFQTQVKTQAKDLNSGFFFRALPGTEAAPSNGYEVQVHNGYKNGDRNKAANAGTGAIFRRIEARRVVSNDLEWCTITLVTSGPRAAVWVDGFEVVNWEDTRAADENPRKGLRVDGGHFSLQGHDPTTDVLFREITVREQAAP
ncbi:3-keto-disaccharide hydrolase [Planctomicrobium sp. SH527]|uniref:3-keto-disaccharide hydrolase n=1 Tax=Planctomicrobium sp. SH527 TaxID=3448123 RepID=UPI003F5C9F40